MTPDLGTVDKAIKRILGGEPHCLMEEAIIHDLKQRIINIS
jgi:hypothetical protein